MSRNHVQFNITAFSEFVNIATVAVSVILIGYGYFSAIGRVAGIA